MEFLWAKRITAAVCAATVCCGAFALMGCGDDKKGGSADGNGATVSAEEWRAALDEKLFENVTMELADIQIYDDGSIQKLRTQIYKLDYNKNMFSYWTSSEYASHRMLLFLPYEDTAQGYKKLPDGNWVKTNGKYDHGNLDDEIGAINAYKMIENANYLTEKTNYSDFKYDDKNGEYKLDVIYREGTEYDGIRSMRIKFDNEKHVSTLTIFIKYDTLSDEVLGETYTYSNYGTTVVEIPDDFPPEFLS